MSDSPGSPTFSPTRRDVTPPPLPPPKAHKKKKREPKTRPVIIDDPTPSSHGSSPRDRTTRHADSPPPPKTRPIINTTATTTQGDQKSFLSPTLSVVAPNSTVATEPEHALYSPSPISNSHQNTRVLGPTRKYVITVVLVGTFGSGKPMFLSLLENLLRARGLDRLQGEQRFVPTLGNNWWLPQPSSSLKQWTIGSPAGPLVRFILTHDLTDKDDQNDKLPNLNISTIVDPTTYPTNVDAILIVSDTLGTHLSAVASQTLSWASNQFLGPVIDNMGFVFTNANLIPSELYLSELQSEFRNAKSWAVRNPADALSLCAFSSEESDSNRSASEKEYIGMAKVIDDILQWLDTRHVLYNQHAE